MNTKHPDAVWQIQRALRGLSDTEAAITRIVPDGHFGSETATAVKDFQQLSGLPVTGEVDSDTWNALFQASAQHKASIKEARPLSIFPYQAVLQKNDSGDGVWGIQIILQALANSYVNFENVPLNGTQTETHCAEVRRFQECALLPVTGAVDTATWDMLCLWYEMHK